MPEYDDELSGVLFPAREKKTDKSPDFTGKCQIDGAEYRIAAWKRTGGSGVQFLSLKFTDMEEHQKYVEESKNALDM